MHHIKLFSGSEFTASYLEISQNWFRIRCRKRSVSPRLSAMWRDKWPEDDCLTTSGLDATFRTVSLPEVCNWNEFTLWNENHPLSSHTAPWPLFCVDSYDMSRSQSTVRDPRDLLQNYSNAELSAGRGRGHNWVRRDPGSRGWCHVHCPLSTVHHLTLTPEHSPSC